MKGKKDIIALDYKIIEINLLKSQHGTHRNLDLTHLQGAIKYGRLAEFLPGKPDFNRKFGLF